jgi:MFS transporter, FSR family, fosmidomycin resistance protein
VLFIVFSSGILEIELSLALFGLFQYTSFPLILALASELSPKGATTFTNSIVWGYGMVFGGAVGPVVIGALSVRPSMLGSAFIIVSIIGAAGVVLLPLIRKP